MTSNRLDFRQSLRIMRAALYTWNSGRRLGFVGVCVCLMSYGALQDLLSPLKQFGFTVSLPESPLYVLYRRPLLTGSLFLLLITELPAPSEFQCSQLIRSNRVSWLIGQLLYCFCMVVIYSLALSFTALVFSISHVRLHSQWSDTLRISEGVMTEAEGIFPSETRAVIGPYSALFYAFVFNGMYWFGLALIILIAGLCGNPLYGLIPAILVQVLPWIFDAFSPSQPTWFPSYYTNVFLPQYARSRGSMLVAMGLFMAANMVTISIMMIRLKLMDILCVCKQGRER